MQATPRFFGLNQFTTSTRLLLMYDVPTVPTTRITTQQSTVYYRCTGFYTQSITVGLLSQFKEHDRLIEDNVILELFWHGQRF